MWWSNSNHLLNISSCISVFRRYLLNCYCISFQENIKRNCLIKNSIAYYSSFRLDSIISIYCSLYWIDCLLFGIYLSMFCNDSGNNRINKSKMYRFYILITKILMDIFFIRLSIMTIYKWV